MPPLSGVGRLGATVRLQDPVGRGLLILTSGRGTLAFLLGGRLLRMDRTVPGERAQIGPRGEVGAEGDPAFEVPTHTGARSSSPMSGRPDMCGVRVSTRSIFLSLTALLVKSRPMMGIADSPGVSVWP